MTKRIAIASLVAVMMAGAGARAEIIEQILVKVNGEIFTKSDLEQRRSPCCARRGSKSI